MIQMGDVRRGVPNRLAGPLALASWVVRVACGRRPAGPRLGFGPN
jgi:hypothetical protein